MKNIIVASSLTLMLSTSSAVYAALASDAVLTINQGVGVCVGGSGTYPYCDLGIEAINGSWFAMDLTDDGAFQNTDKLPLVMDEGIRIGVAQPTTGQSHAGSPTGMENTSIDLAWSFLGNTGMHNTVSPITVVSDDGAGHVQLDFSGWSFDWNGIENISLGGDPLNFPADTGMATVICGADCSLGDTYTLDYTAHVPVGDVSGFGGVYYGLHLEGTIATVPVPAAFWLFVSGLLAIGGSAWSKRRV